MAHRSSAGLSGGNGATANVPVPAGAASGDIAVVGIYKENTAAITTVPSGFTLKTSLTTSGTTRGTLYVYWKRLTGADAGTYNFAWSGNTFRGAVSGLWSGRAGAGDPFDGTVGAAENAAIATTLNVSTSPAAANGDAVGIWTNFTGGNAYTPPTNYTERQDLDVITLDTRDAVASGSTGSISATSNVSGFQKAFLGVLAAAGGTDATPAPAVIAATVATPQATPSAGATKSPAATAVVVAAPQATPSVSDVGAPAATATAVSLPQVTISANAAVTPATIAATVSAPPVGVNVAARPAVLSAVVGVPQATGQTAGNATATPAAVTATATVPAASPIGAATASPATLAAAAALPTATAQGSGSTTVTPAAVAAVVAVPLSVQQTGSTVSPGVIVTTVAAPRPNVGTATGPASIAVLTTLPAASPVTSSSVTRTPEAVAVAVGMPALSIVAEGAGLRGRLGQLSPHLPGSLTSSDASVGGQIGELDPGIPGRGAAPETFDLGGTIH